MTVAEWIAIIVAIGLVTTCTITLLAIAWSVFEDTKLGEYLVDKLKERKEE